MGRQSKFVALALLAVLLIVPVSAWAACDAMLRSACEPMPCHSGMSHPTAVSAATPDCCVVKSDKANVPSAPAQTAPRAEAVAPAAAAAIPVTLSQPVARVLTVSSPPAATHSSQSLLCTFLI